MRMRSGSSTMEYCQNQSALRRNMWVLLLFFSVAVPSFASKEHVPLQDLPEDEKNILFELVKRLKQDGDVDDRGWKDEAPQCGISTNKTSIIKKVDSVNNGAVFLRSYKDVTNNDACSELCCTNDSCDLAVFEDKGDHYCYLFRCGGKCKFSHHSRYISNEITHHTQVPKQPSSDQDSSELDLISLDQGFDDEGDDKDRFAQVQTTIAATPSTAMAMHLRAHSVGLDGHCERDLHCEDPNAACNLKRCRCQEGYYQKGHICRQVCPPSNFECLELGTLGRGPQCVTDIQVCDAVMQCADGSDEYNCPDSGVPPASTWQQQPVPLAPAQPAQQLQQSPMAEQPQQQQPYLQGGYSDPQYSYNEQGLMASGAGNLGQPGNPGALPNFAGQGQYYGQDGRGPYPSYNSQQSQVVPGSGQPSVGSPQVQPQAYMPAYDGAASDQYSGKGVSDFPNVANKKAGSPKQQQNPKSLYPPAKVVPTSQSSASSQQQHQSGPQQAVHGVMSQVESEKQKYPQESKQMYQESKPNQPDLSPSDSDPSFSNPGSLQSFSGPKQSYKGLQQIYEGPQQSNEGPQQSYKVLQQPYKEPQQSYKSPVPQPSGGDPQSKQSSQKTGPEHPQPVDSQPYPASAAQPGVQNPVQKIGVPKSGRPMPVDGMGQSVPGQPQLSDSRVYVEGGGQPISQGVESSGNGGYSNTQKQKLPQPVLPQPNPKVQNVAPNIAQPVQPKLPVNSGPVTISPAQGPHHTASQSEQHADQRDYIGPSHSKVQNVPDSQYQPPHAKAKPEQPHPHSAYDVRIGEPGSAGRKPPGSQKSFLNPTEMDDLDAQGSSHFLENFGDQYLPQQGFSQHYIPYSRYPNAYPQNSGSQGNNYPGIPDQMYPGMQGQRMYPQQGYLDLGYPSQYEFGEFDPSYAEADSYPGSHDIPSYRPNSKLGYDGPYKGKATPDKGYSAPQQGSSVPAGQDRKAGVASQEDKQDAGSAGEQDHPDEVNKSEPRTNPVPPAVSSDNTKDNNKPSVNADRSQDTADKVDHASSKTVHSDDGFSKVVENTKGKDMEMELESPPRKPPLNDLIEQQNAYIARVKVDLPTEPANMEGPIIALSLGLAFTVIILVFVACRLRNVRRRLRKGRPLHSNEADYLINGMYL